MPSVASSGFGQRRLFQGAILIIGLVSCYHILSPNYTAQNTVIPEASQEPIKTKAVLRTTPKYLGYQAPFKNYPLTDTLEYEKEKYGIRYFADSLLCERVQLYLKRHRPEVGVYAVADLETGHILAFGERQDSAESFNANLIFGKNYPAASLAKTVTALAAIKDGITAEDSLTQIGSYHTLYKRQLSPQPQDNFPKVSLKKAFAYSINPAFGLLAQNLGGDKLNAAAAQLLWNKEHPSPLRVESHYTAPDSGYHLAEVGCGFTQRLSISPLHALELAGAVGSDGTWKPSRFGEIFSVDSIELAHNKEEPLTTVLSPLELKEMEALWAESCRKGTARKGFHKILRRSHLDKIDVGAKTGSLDGKDPEGRYDWFMGYAKLKDNPKKGIAIVVMQVHQTYQSLRSTYIAALLIKDWLKFQKEEETNLAKGS